MDGINFFRKKKENKTPKLFKVFQVLQETNLEIKKIKTKTKWEQNSSLGYSLGGLALFDGSETGVWFPETAHDSKGRDSFHPEAASVSFQARLWEFLVMWLKYNLSWAFISPMLDFTAVTLSWILLLWLSPTDGETNVCLISYRDGQNLGNWGGEGQVAWEKLHVSVHILSLLHWDEK